MRPELTFGQYKALLMEAQNRDFQIIPFRDAGYMAEKCMILRHDIPNSTDGIVKFLEIERTLGIVSSFYFRTRAEEYNFYGPGIQTIVRDIVTTHEIGISFEGKEDFELLHDLYGFRNCGIDVRSFGRYFPADGNQPTAEDLQVPLVGQPLRYVQHPAYYKDGMFVVSDMQQDWVTLWPDYLDHQTKLHVLTHPALWHKQATRRPRVERRAK